MERLCVNLDDKEEQKSYYVRVTDSYEDLLSCFENEYTRRKLIVITDENVKRLQFEQCYQALHQRFDNIFTYVIKPGEESKQLPIVGDIYQFLCEKHIEKKDLIIALGGGVVGDIAGFVASTYLRGIGFVNIPTTLLAQIDSSIGGKTGVNYSGIKNIIGSFYQPQFVFSNTKVLETLSTREFRCGLSEAIIHSIIYDKNLFEFICANTEKIMSKEQEELNHLITESARVKIAIVEQDVYDTGKRELLNFGHTFGHAIESVYYHELHHGECVSIGSVCAFRMAEQLNLVDEKETQKLIDLYKQVELPYKFKRMDVNRVYQKMLYDKKRCNDEFHFILPVQIGKVLKFKSRDEDLVKHVLQFVAKQ